jgi:hypothetical protein
LLRSDGVAILDEIDRTTSEDALEIEGAREHFEKMNIRHPLGEDTS